VSFYEVVVVERPAPHTEITRFDADEGDGDTRLKATVTDVSKILNLPGSCELRLSLSHPASALVVPLMCEVQIYRDGVRIAWCVPLQPALEGGDWVFNCPGLGWYFTGRVFGPISVNYLSNPDFETDLTGWSSVDVDSGTRSTVIRLNGPGSLRLVSTSSGDHYAEHTFTVDTGGVGLVLFLSYMYWIDPAFPLVAPAFEERGVYISSPSSLPDGSPSWEPITMNSPVGEIVVTPPVELHLPPDLVDEPVNVRLYSPHCGIHYGGGLLTALESVSSEPEGTDVTEMMRRVVAYMHQIYDYDIATDTPAAGVTEITAHQFADLRNCYDALLTYPARGLADFEIDPTDRTFKTHAPRKGTYKPGHTLTVPGTDVNLEGYRLDGQQVSTRVIRTGPGSGATRRIGFAQDTSAFDGLPLDNVEDAPPEIPIDGLRGLALADLARLSQIVELPEISVAAEGFWGDVDTGDTVDIDIDWGVIQVATTRRVTSMRLNPLTDRVLVGTNVE
jgi:hypothetical protein